MFKYFLVLPKIIRITRSTGGNEVDYLVHHLTNNELTNISYFEHLKHEFNNKKEPDTI
jgi:hypothetical protein